MHNYQTDRVADRTGLEFVLYVSLCSNNLINQYVTRGTIPQTHLITHQMGQKMGPINNPLRTPLPRHDSASGVTV